MNKNLELIIDSHAIVGEGPSWDVKRQILYWVDVYGKKVHIYNPNTDTSKTIDTGQYVGAAVPCKSGGLMLALQNGFYSLDLKTGQMEPIVDPEEGLSENRFNDGKCDARGRFFAGTMSVDHVTGSGSLYCMDTDLKVKTVLRDVTVSNGIAWTADNKTMYFIDTPKMMVAAYDYDIETGMISNGRCAIEIPGGIGVPDGMAIDEEGMLWIAMWDGHRICRWDPNINKLLETVIVPATNVTSCVFGGEELDELYITTALLGINESQLVTEPNAGGVFRMKTNVKGTATYQFGT